MQFRTLSVCVFVLTLESTPNRHTHTLNNTCTRTHTGLIPIFVSYYHSVSDSIEKIMVVSNQDILIVFFV